MDKPEVLRCLAVPDYYSDKELAVVNDALKLCDVETVGLLRHSSAVATAFAHSQGGVDAASTNKGFQPFPIYSQCSCREGFAVCGLR